MASGGARAEAGRAGARLRHGAMLLGVAAALLLALAGCEPGTTAKASASAAPAHMEFLRGVSRPTPDSPVYRPGDALAFAWASVAQRPSAAASAPPERLTLALYGPYATWQEARVLQNTIGDGRTSVTLPQPAITAEPLATTAWEPGPFTLTLRLPEGLQPGSYVYVARVKGGPDGGDAVPSAYTGILTTVAR